MPIQIQNTPSHTNKIKLLDWYSNFPSSLFLNVTDFNISTKSHYPTATFPQVDSFQIQNPSKTQSSLWVSDRGREREASS